MRGERETRFRQQAFPSIPLAEMLSFVRRKESDLFETWSSNLHVAVWKTFYELSGRNKSNKMNSDVKKDRCVYG